MVWNYLAVLIGAEALQVNRRNGCLQYPAVQITYLGNALSFTTGYYETQERRKETETISLEKDDGRFVMAPHLRPENVDHYLRLLELAKVSAESYKTKARASGVRNAPRRKTA